MCVVTLIALEIAFASVTWSLVSMILRQDMLFTQDIGYGNRKRERERERQNVPLCVFLKCTERMTTRVSACLCVLVCVCVCVRG